MFLCMEEEKKTSEEKCSRQMAKVKNSRKIYASVVHSVMGGSVLARNSVVLAPLLLQTILLDTYTHTF